MTLWTIVILGCIGTLVPKFLGYALPAKWFAAPRANRIADLLTVALLAALIAVQTFATGQQLDIDARLPAVVVAAGMFALRVPYVVVVFAAAAIAAGIRALMPGLM